MSSTLRGGFAVLYLLDTDVVSNLEKKRPNPNLVAWLKGIEVSRLAIPLSVVFEVQKGIELARHTHEARALEREAWLEALIRNDDMQIIRPDTAVARLHAQMVCTPKLKNFLIPSPGSTRIKTGEDLLIAAIAIVYQCALVTFNDRDFSLIHEHFPLPGLFHPGRLEWIVPVQPDASDG